MAVLTDPRNGLSYNWALGDNNWHTLVNTNFKKIGTALHLSAKDRHLAVPPVTPADGDAYIVAGGATGTWVGHTNHVAVWIAQESAWYFLTPIKGYQAWVEDEAFMAVWNGSAWVPSQPVPSATILGSFRNKVINGDFRFAQRATSQTSSGYGSDDRWFNSNGGSTKVHSIQPFTLGQTAVPGEPKNYSRTVVTSIAGASNYVAKVQKVEGVRTFAGQDAVLGIWAKADAARNIAVEFIQAFGTGGSPSADVTSIGVTTLALTTSWQYFQVPVTFPSIAGKVLGSNNNDYVFIHFWFDAGSDFNTRTNNLGQQSGTFEVAEIQMHPGSVLVHADYERRPDPIELMLCQRYYEIVEGVATPTMEYRSHPYKVEKRAAPAMGTPIFDAGTGAAFMTVNFQGGRRALYQSGVHSGIAQFQIAVDAEL